MIPNIIAELKPYILYNNSNGTQTNFTLTDNASNNDEPIPFIDDKEFNEWVDNNIKREDIINHLNELVSLATYLRAEVDILLKESQKQPEIKYTSSERLSDEDKQLLIKILSKYIDDSGMYADENSNNFI